MVAWVGEPVPLVVRSPLSVPDSGVNRPTKYTASRLLKFVA